MKKFLITIFVILFISLGVAGYWYYQRNLYSKETLKLEILGEESAQVLEEVEYIVKYKNNGRIRLEKPELIFEYPEHSIVEQKESLREIISLEDIYPGEERSFSFKARLLGKEGEAKIAKAWLSYSPKNLSARYESHTTFTTIIKAVPLTFEFDLPSKIESGKEFRFRLNYFSNINYPLSDMRAIIEYPSDFEFIESSPKALEQTEWEIPYLDKAEGGRIEVLGKVRGEIGEQKIFGARIGIWQEGEFILLKKISKGIRIIKPSLYITQRINGNPQYIANPGDLLHYEIFFRNIGESPITNMFLVVTLEGNIFDFHTIKSTQGSFELGDNSIIFDQRRVSKLQFLDIQEEGKVEFWIELKEDWEIDSLADKNPVIRDKIYLSQVREEFENKVNSKLEIKQKAYYEDEVFGNSGPLPPKVGKTTTYTIIWQIKNYYNDAKDVKVKAFLPKEVKLTGKIFPEQEAEKFSFDSSSREIVWKVGELPAGTGILSSIKTCAFQIALTPGHNQKDKPAVLIDKVKITGEDVFTQATLKQEASAIDSTLPDDKTVSPEMGIVQ